MCLITQQNKPNVTDKDIVCYKLARKYRYASGKVSTVKFASQYIYFEYVLGVSYTEASFQELLCGCSVDKGFHSYKRLQDMEDARNMLVYPEGFAILKCVIPAGARYWEGVNYTDRNRKEYCSDKIKIVAWKTNPEQPWNETSHAVTE